jgi:mannose-6-phosphate isomerase-like protein (cupin superfamily)
VIDGNLNIEFRDGKVTLESVEMFVVPKGVEHKPVAESECQIMLVEPKGVVNTGETGDKLTANNDVWI